MEFFENKNQQSVLSLGCIQKLFIGLLAILIVSVVILSWVPPVSRDALTHHLAVPKLYLQHGGIYEIPAIVFSYYPMNLDLLYMIPLYWGNDIAPKFIHFLFALLTAGLLYGYIKKRLGPVWALFGALFFLSLPIVVKLSITVYVDLGLVFFSTASLLSFLKWIESRFHIKYLLLSAVSCGLALGTKYNALVVFFILTLFVPLVYIRQARKEAPGENLSGRIGPANLQSKAVGWGIIFCLVALLGFSPWMIRNYAWTENPIYPLYNHVFNPPQPGPTESLDGNGKDAFRKGPATAAKQNSARWSSFAIRSVLYNESWWEIAIIPIRIFFQGQDDNPQYFDGKLSPFLFLLPFFAFWQIKNNPPVLRTEKQILGGFTILYILYAFFQTDLRIRYIAPIIPPLVILATFGLNQITAAATTRWANSQRGIAAACLLLLSILILSFNAVYIVEQFKYVKPFSYMSGKIDRDRYITTYRPEYAALQYSNQNLPDASKLMGLFIGNRRYYSDRELIFGNNQFRKIVKGARSYDDVVSVLKGRGFTHLLIRFELFNRWAGVQFNDREREMLNTFFKKNVKLMFAKGGYGLFEFMRN